MEAELKPELCPLCAQPTATAFKPFCSRGCKDRDLLQWLGDGYRIPGAAVDPGGVDKAADAD